MKLTGAQILIECLKEQGVDTVFGYPGGSVLNIYDALYERGQDITHVLTSHEQGASHAADGYARASGKTGVCIATSGPGATNLVTGIATAYMDSVPMVAITGQVPTSLLGRDAFQEVDITGITIPITKHNCIVKNVDELAESIRLAFKIASEGRPGPVLVDVCKDVTAAVTEYTPISIKETKTKEFIKKLPEVNESILAQAIKAINNSKRPLILSGGGSIIADIKDELLTLSEKALIPVANTLMGLGSFNGMHEYFTGLIGMHGSRVSNKANSECDLFIAIGARFSDRVISNLKRFAPNAEIMHIDIDPAEIGKNIKVHYPLNGDIKAILRRIIEAVEVNEDKKAWINQIKEWKEKFKKKYVDDGTLKPQYIIESLHKLTNGDAIIATEVGQNQIWAAQYYKYSRPRQIISSGGLGTMGYGMGAAIGAKMACPDKTVINVAGDGCFKMNCNELATAVKYKLPVIIALMNNGVLGMVRQWQTMFYDKRYSQTTIEGETDYVKLAEAFGAVGINVTKPEQVEDAIKEALKSKDRPVVINFVIDKDERVLPIVPPGAGIDELIHE